MKRKIIRVNFPFIDDPAREKSRPALALTKPFGKHGLVIVAYITSNITQKDKYDIDINSSNKNFKKTGLSYDSLIKLTKLTTITLDSITGKVGILTQEVNNLIDINLKLIYRLK